jgi:hypothetical protein
MDRIAEAKDLGALVAGLYAAGARLVVSEDGRRIGIIGDAGPGIEAALKANKEKFLEMLTGDPLSGPGWEGRTALHKQALLWLDERTQKEAKERVTAALCRRDVADGLNTAWCSDADGSFEKFRVALKRYIETGLKVTEERRGRA